MPTVPSRIHKGVAMLPLHDSHVGRLSAEPLLHSTGERFELRRQRRAIRPRRNARHHSRAESSRRRDLRGIDLQRNPERRPLIRETELWLHDSDHRAVLAGKGVALADHRCI